MRRILPSLVTIALCAPALAITGDAPPAQGYAAHAIVMIVDPRGDLCTGTAFAHDLVLTAAHCVAADRHIKIFQTGQTVTVRGIARHPQFNPAAPPSSQAVIGVVSWTTAPANEEGCGGLTGVTPFYSTATGLRRRL
jgi:hypothetical protein